MGLDFSYPFMSAAGNKINRYSRAGVIFLESTASTGAAAFPLMQYDKNDYTEGSDRGPGSVSGIEVGKAKQRNDGKCGKCFSALLLLLSLCLSCYLKSFTYYTFKKELYYY